MRISCIFLLISLINLSACSENSRHTASNITEGTALLLVAVPIGIVTSPIWIPEMIIDQNKKTVVVKAGAPKEEIRKLMGEPTKTYTCKNSVSVWQYEKNSKYKGGSNLYFSSDGLLIETKDTIDESDNCQAD